VTAPNASPLPPDPARYDEVRNVAARKRGLEGPYIAGGYDPELDATLRRERRYVRVLVPIVVIIVATGLVLGFIGAILATPPA